MQFKEYAQSHLSYMQRLLKHNCLQLEKMPSGKLVKKKAHGKIYYYVSEKDTLRSLLGKYELQNRYIEKEFLELENPKLTCNIQLLERFLRKYEPLIVSPSLWDSIEAEQNPYQPEDKRHLYRQIRFRSKSEAVIASILTSYGIEFKYEPALDLNGQRIYPDFVVRRPRDGKIFIWEHFGMIYDESYLDKTFHKLSEYHLSGYDLWDNLIISFDQSDGSIDLTVIEKIITLFLL